MAEIQSDLAGLTEANEVHIKENRAVQGEETDLLEAVAASKQAIVGLSKRHAELAQVRAVVSRLQGVRGTAAKGLDKGSWAALKSFLKLRKRSEAFWHALETLWDVLEMIAKALGSSNTL